MSVTVALILLAYAQAQGDGRASVSGIVRDATTGEPVADVRVFVNDGAVPEVKTSADGRYSLKGFEPGRHFLTAMLPRFHVVTNRVVTLTARQELKDVDFRLPRPAVLAGRVTDESKRPLAGVSVSAGTSFYVHGALMSAPMRTTTDDRGEYRFQGLAPGRAYLVAAGIPEAVDVIAGPTAKPGSKKGWERLYYPNSPRPEGAVAVTLMPGEVREGADFRMLRQASFCIEGLAAGAAADGARVTISTSDGPPGWSERLGEGLTDAKGRFSACGLPPGGYRAVALPFSGFSPRGVVSFDIFDRDVRNLVIDLRPSMEIRGEVRWIGAPPANPVSQPIMIVLTPVGRVGFAGESLQARCDLPGEFAFPSLFIDEYRLRLSSLPPGVYAKDVTYGTASALRMPLRAGTASAGSPIRITLSNDGGSLRVRTVDRDGKPVADAGISIFPPDVSLPDQLAHYFIPYGTDQDGYRTVTNLPPGRYYALARTQPFGPNDSDPTVLTSVLQARSRAKEVEVTAGTTTNVTLEPIEIR